MAGELQLAHTAGRTVYAQIRTTTGTIWNTAGTPAFQAYSTANIADYDIALTQQGTGSGYYVGDFPTAITAGQYNVTYLERAGGSPAETDVKLATEAIQWSGTAVIPLNNAPVNVVQFGGTNGTFSGGRPQVNMTHVNGTAYATSGLGMIYGSVLSGSVTDASVMPTNQTFDVTTLAATDSNAYKDCVIFWTSGNNAGRAAIVASSSWSGTYTNITLAESMPSTVATPDGFVVLPATAEANVLSWGSTAVSSANVRADVRQYGGTNGTFSGGRPEVNAVRLAGQTITASGGVTFPAATLASTTNITAASGITLADDAITAAKFDESTAFPLKAADAGSTYIARTGADADTLETISDQIDGVGGGGTDWTANERTAIRSILGIPASGTTPDDPTTGILDTIRDAVAVVDGVVDSILDDTGTAGVVVAAGSKTGYSLTPTTGLGNQTADITGSLSGSVGSVTGNVGGSVASIATGGITAASFAAGAIDAAAIATNAIDADALATDAVNEINSASNPLVLQTTTIATLASQVSFTLTAGSADNGAYNGCIAIVTDASTATQKARGVVLQYVGSTRTVRLAFDPGVFTMAAGDSISIMAANQTPVIHAEMSVKSTAGTTAQLTAWMEVAGTRVPITTIDAAATCSFVVREHGSGSNLFTASGVAADITNSMFEVEQASPAFTDDRQYELTATITLNSVAYSTTHSRVVIG